MTRITIFLYLCSSLSFRLDMLIMPGRFLRFFLPGFLKIFMKEFIVAVDFDGTIVDEHYPGIGPIKRGAKEALEAFKDLGMTIIIWTCREGEYENDAIKFLIDNGIPFDYINQNDPRRIEFYGSDCRKLSAEVHIDDRNLGGFPGWDYAETLVKNMFFERRN